MRWAVLLLTAVVGLVELGAVAEPLSSYHVAPPRASRVPALFLSQHAIHTPTLATGSVVRESGAPTASWLSAVVTPAVATLNAPLPATYRFVLDADACFGTTSETLCFGLGPRSVYYSSTTRVGDTPNSVGLCMHGQVYNSGALVTTVAPLSVGDVVEMVVSTAVGAEAVAFIVNGAHVNTQTIVYDYGVGPYVGVFSTWCPTQAATVTAAQALTYPYPLIEYGVRTLPADASPPPVAAPAPPLGTPYHLPFPAFALYGDDARPVTSLYLYPTFVAFNVPWADGASAAVDIAPLPSTRYPAFAGLVAGAPGVAPAPALAGVSLALAGVAPRRTLTITFDHPASSLSFDVVLAEDENDIIFTVRALPSTAAVPEAVFGLQGMLPYQGYTLHFASALYPVATPVLYALSAQTPLPVTIALVAGKAAVTLGAQALALNGTRRPLVPSPVGGATLELSPEYDAAAATYSVNPVLIGILTDDHVPSPSSPPHPLSITVEVTLDATGASGWRTVRKMSRDPGAHVQTGLWWSLRNNAMSGALVRLTFDPPSSSFASLSLWGDVDERVSGAHSCNTAKYDLAVVNVAGYFACYAPYNAGPVAGLTATAMVGAALQPADLGNSTVWSVELYPGAAPTPAVRVPPEAGWQAHGPNSGWLAASAGHLPTTGPHPPIPFLVSLAVAGETLGYKSMFADELINSVFSSITLQLWYEFRPTDAGVVGCSAGFAGVEFDPPLASLPATATSAPVTVTLTGGISDCTSALKLWAPGAIRVELETTSFNSRVRPTYMSGAVKSRNWQYGPTIAAPLSGMHYLDRLGVSCPEGSVLSGLAFARDAEGTQFSGWSESVPSASSIPRRTYAARSVHSQGLTPQVRCIPFATTGAYTLLPELTGVGQPYGGIVDTTLDLHKVGAACPPGTGLTDFAFLRAGLCNNPAVWTDGVVLFPGCTGSVDEGLAAVTSCANVSSTRTDVERVWRGVGLGAPMFDSALDNLASAELPMVLERVGAACHGDEYVAGFRFLRGGCDLSLSWLQGRRAADYPPCVGDEDNPARNGLELQVLCQAYAVPPLFALGAFEPNPTHPSLGLWLSAEHLHASGVSAGERVVRWPNRAVNSKEIAHSDPRQDVPWFQPVLLAPPASLSAHPSVYFDGVDDNLAGACVTLPQHTIVAVLHDTGTTASCCAGVYTGINAGWKGQQMFVGLSTQRAGADDARIMLDYSGSPYVGSHNIINTTQVYALVYNETSTTLYRNGHVEVELATGHGALLEQFLIGTRREPSEHGFSSYLIDRYFRGHVYELAVYNEVLSAEKLNELGVYLAQKYAIEGTTYSCSTLSPAVAATLCGGIGAGACPSGNTTSLSCTACPPGTFGPACLPCSASCPSGTACDAGPSGTGACVVLPSPPPPPPPPPPPEAAAPPPPAVPGRASSIRGDLLRPDSATHGSWSVALYVLVVGLVAVCVAGAGVRRRNLARPSAAPRAWLALDALKYVLVTNPVGGLAIVVPRDAFPRGARVAAFCARLAIVLAATAALPLVNPTTFNDLGTALVSAEALAAGALGVVVASGVSSCAVVPTVQAAARRSPGAGSAAGGILAGAFAAVGVGLLVMADVLDDVPFKPMAVGVLWAASVIVDVGVLCPVTSLVAWAVLGSRAVRLAARPSSGVEKGTAVVKPAGQWADDAASVFEGRSDDGTMSAAGMRGSRGVALGTDLGSGTDSSDSESTSGL